MTSKVSSVLKTAITQKAKKAKPQQVDLTKVRDRQAAYKTDLRGKGGSTNLKLPANAKYWSKESVKPSKFGSKSMPMQKKGSRGTNHVFSFVDPKAGQQYRHVQTDSANPGNITVNGKPLNEMTPKFTDPDLGKSSNQFDNSTPNFGTRNSDSSTEPTEIDFKDDFDESVEA
jgi:hypothetical protein